MRYYISILFSSFFVCIAECNVINNFGYILLMLQYGLDIQNIFLWY